MTKRLLNSKAKQFRWEGGLWSSLKAEQGHSSKGQGTGWMKQRGGEAFLGGKKSGARTRIVVEGQLIDSSTNRLDKKSSDLVF